MSDSVNFKFGSTIEGKDIAANDLVVINEGIAEGGDERYGSIYKGDKIVGTTKADSLYTTDSITVTGVNVGNLTNGLEIEAGKSIMDILRQMLMKELGVTATRPSVTLAGDKASVTVEKGTKISRTYTATFTDGKYEGVSGYDYSLDAGCTVSDCTWSGITGTESIEGNVCKIIANEFAVNSTVTVKATVSFNAATNVPKSNMGNEITTGLIGASTVASGTITYTPSLYWWVGSSETKFDDMTWDSAAVRNLSLKQNWVSTKTVNAIFPVGAKQQVIAIPASMTLSVADKSGNNLTDMFSSTATVTVTCGGTHTESYKIYVAPANAGLSADSPEMVITIK